MKLFRVLALTLALSSSVYAGNIQNGVVQPPPPDPATAQTVVVQSAPVEPATTQTTTEQTPTVAEILLTVVRVLGLI
jgi:hypothetical protein